MEREEHMTSPKKKLKSQAVDTTTNLNFKTSVTCSNVPESLFDAETAKKHFSKFGRVQRIRLLPKKHMCIIDYDQPTSVERAVLNAGAFDGFMFDVTRTKPRGSSEILIIGVDCKHHPLKLQYNRAACIYVEMTI